MLEIMVGFAICILAVIGLAETLRGIRHFFYMPPQERTAFIVTSCGHDEKIEYFIRALAFRAQEMQQSNPMIIVVVDDGMDTQTREICRMLSDELKCVRICETKELAGILCGEK